jgi:hypothetical protein
MSLARGLAIPRRLAILSCAALSLLAAPRLTTIQDSIYKADGTAFSGTAVISWMPFDTSDNAKIGLQSLTVQITNGFFHVQLVPNADATPVNYYTVQYSSDGKQQFTETWSVPSATASLRIKDVRVAVSTGSSTSGTTGGGVVQPPSQTPITESNVIGLLTDLSLRPVKGSTYTAGRAAVVNDSGAVDSAEGNLSDCVHVDGSSGPCFDATQLPGYVDCETPGGIVDGSNAAFTLSATPYPTASLWLSRNGLVQLLGSDYTIQTDGSVLFASASIPQPGDVLLASYRTSYADSQAISASPQSVQAPKVQILCSGSGTSTSSANNTSLGSCTIPANTLSPGDRVEVRFTLAHQGTARGFGLQVLWGQTTIVQRTASASDALVTGHGDASVGTTGATLDMQTWGTVLTLDSRIAAASDVLTSAINVGFLASMSTAGADSVSLQNYTVLRYPAQ